MLGLTLRAEIGDGTRFRDAAALACYAGLVPRVDSSGDRYYVGRITRQGSPWLRWALVEAARHAIRRDIASAVGPAAGRAQRRHESPRRVGAAPERRGCRAVATACVTSPLHERVHRFHRVMHPGCIVL